MTTIEPVIAGPSSPSSAVEGERTKEANSGKRPKIYLLKDSVKKILYVMGSALLVFATARNSFLGHINHIWGATGRFWQSCWNHIYREWSGDNDFMFTFLAIFLITTSVFWLGNSFFTLLDVAGLPQVLKKYKIQVDVQLEMPKFLKAVPVVLFNNIVVGLPFCATTAGLYIQRGCSVNGDLPTFQGVLLEILVCSLVLEFFFYYSHRLFHHPRLYNHIHKMHHEWTAPIGLVSIYAHPLEHLVCNVIPTALGPLLMGSHLATSLMWFSLAIMSTTIAHCGYHLPLLPSPEAHDYHHLMFNQNFGVLGVLDRLHGTDIQFRNSLQYKRHEMLLSLVPLSQQYPAASLKKKLE